MKLVKGKVRFIRSLIGCVVFPLLLCYFYSYVQEGSNWYEVNQWLGVTLGIVFIGRGIFEYKIAKHMQNTKISFLGAIVILIYVVLRYFHIM
ncbi:hypothetical protein [uncultured Clostridium sp.]|uniref:hypothetical protein n=1 Tax=uncultured Clostridium sp. TaxID=59620 RepID=UPI0026026C77|nr:hypothetical protein [uncultured Clostridium sp.]